MDYDKILLAVKEEIVKEGLDCMMQSLEDSQQKNLLIYTGEDPAHRMRLIQIKVQTKETNPLSKGPKREELACFQFDAFFPFTVEDLSLEEVAQFLHFLNLQVEIPGFYLNHLDNTILYRYVLLSEGERIPYKTILALVGMAMLFQDVFSQTLERLAMGKVSFCGLMEEVQETLLKVPDRK